jgi:hypothetical protein
MDRGGYEWIHWNGLERWDYSSVSHVHMRQHSSTASQAVIESEESTAPHLKTKAPRMGSF